MNTHDALSRLVLYALPAFLAGVIITHLLHHHFVAPLEDPPTEFDTTGDGRVDTWYRYLDEATYRMEHDRKGDGKVDYWLTYSNGVMVKAEADDNFDGKVDVWEVAQGGWPLRTTVDVDWNGIPDVTYEYEHGVLAKATWHPNQGPVARIEYFLHGVKTHEHADTTGDGVLDSVRHYDPFGNSVPAPYTLP